MEPLLLFAHLSSSSALVPLSMGLYQWKNQSSYLKLVTLIPLISAITDGLSLLLLSNGFNTWPLLNVFYCVQFSLLFFAIGSERKIYFLRALFFGCIGFALINFLFIQSPRTFNSYTSYAGGIIMILSSLNYLYWLLNEMPAERVYRLPLFWVAFGVLVYFGGTLFLFLFNNYVIAHLPQSYRPIWTLHNLLNITKNIFLFAAIWTHYKSRTSPP